MLGTRAIATFALGTAALLGCSVVHRAEQRDARRVEKQLVDAGFQKVPADTPDKRATLHRLPAYSLRRTTLKDGTTRWYYADPDCPCAYVGNAAAAERYRRALAQQAGEASAWAGSPETPEGTQDFFSPENPELYGAPENW